MEIFQTFSNLILLFLASTGFAYIILKFTSKKFIENVFSKQLENHKQKLNAEFNRMTIVHQKEIEVIPQAWKLLQIAMEQVNILTSLLKSYPDVDNYSEDDYRKYIEESSFSEKDKQELLLTNMGQRFKKYSRIADKQEILNANTKMINFHKYIQEHSIFLVDEIKEKFLEIDGKVFEIIRNTSIHSQYEMDKKYDDLSKNFNTVRDEIHPILQELDLLIKNRLHVEKTE